MNPRLAPKWIVGALAVALTAGVLLFACLGSMPFSDRDEGEYAASVAEMRRSGDYFIPRLNGQLYLEKPILIFWAVAAGQGVFGVNELGARFPSALSAWLLTVLLGLVVWRATGQLGWGGAQQRLFCLQPLGGAGGPRGAHRHAAYPVHHPEPAEFLLGKRKER